MQRNKQLPDKKTPKMTRWHHLCRLLVSKKNTEIRRKELLEVVSPPLLDYLRDNADTMVTDKATSVTISDILASACGDLRPAMTAVAQLANQELVPGGTNKQVVCVSVCVCKKCDQFQSWLM